MAVSIITFPVSSPLALPSSLAANALMNSSYWLKMFEWVVGEQARPKRGSKELEQSTATGHGTGVKIAEARGVTGDGPENLP